ncbi:hypothetical protein HYC85_009078 [Camellia sinensis]|uniref:ABC-2 type transporter transmembrane domain-containing protein n=1 Tax=Camellia sinensis TaxID=4442 RepID=A0A7J7HGQ0_CAMSI|nr:hypothetical protein HYC85_009078 [Camellia sinensis]
MNEFVPQRTSTYISQHDLHIGELTVRETLAFSARCQGVGARYGRQYHKKDKGPILGLEVCADTMGNEMVRGISGGQKSESRQFYNLSNCELNQAVHPHPSRNYCYLSPPANARTYDLFDDIILLSDGKIVYEGPRENVLEFLNTWASSVLRRKELRTFYKKIHWTFEVTSKKDQEQYWAKRDKSGISIISRNELAIPFGKAKSHPVALTTKNYGVSKKELLKALISREYLLMKRNSFVYIFKFTQLIIMAFIAMTIFLRTEMPKKTTIDGTLAMTILKLSTFYKHRDPLFFPAWAYSLPQWILKITITFVEVDGFWNVLTHWGIRAEHYCCEHFWLIYTTWSSCIGWIYLVKRECKEMVDMGLLGLTFDVSAERYSTHIFSWFM